MAFNPFHSFRKHQKVIFAVLAIICMFVFVLQFGRGDPIERMMRLFGGGRAKGPLVTTLYSKKVYQSDLSRLLTQRRLASTFLASVIVPGQQETAMIEQRLRTRLSPDGVKILEQLQQSKFDRLLAELSRNRDQPDMRFRSMTKEQQLESVFRDMSLLGHLRSQLLRDKKMEDARDVGALLSALQLEAWQTDPRHGREEFFFGGTSRPEDLLDFQIWKHQADRLGIVLTEADVIKAINREANDREVLDGTSFADDPKVKNFMLQFVGAKGQTVSDLVMALADEFRVAMAQEALLGQEPGIRAYRASTSIDQMPVAVTPDEFLRYYRDQRTTLTVDVLGLPMREYLAQVKETPSEKALRELHDRYWDQEPGPDRDRPGFKEPRRVRVEYVSARADSPFYKKAARAIAQNPHTQLHRVPDVISGPMNTYAAGGGVAWIAPVAIPLLQDPLREEYDKYLREELDRVKDGFGVSVALYSFRMEQVAEAAQELGDALTGVSPLATASFAAGTKEIYTQANVKAIGAMVNAGFSCAAMAGIGAAPYPALTLAMPQTHTWYPERSVKGELLERLEFSLAKTLLKENLEALKTELTKLKGKPEEARKYVDQKIKDFGLEHHVMEEARPQYPLPAEPPAPGLADDPALKKLRDAYTAAYQNLPPPGGDFVQSLLLRGTGTFDPIPWSNRMVGEVGLSLWDAGEEPFLIWRMEDKPARTLSFEAVRENVRAAWRLDRARALARADAERIQKEWKKQNAPGGASAFLREQITKENGGKFFELTNVARLVKPKVPVPIASGLDSYRPYAAPKTDIAYPRANLVERLMSLAEPGDSVVLSDRPEEHFYVAVLRERSKPTREEFFELYDNAARATLGGLQALAPDPLWGWCVEEYRRSFREKFMQELRAEAGAVDPETGKLVLPKDLAMGKSGGGDEE
jgi:hypothetical protein